MKKSIKIILILLIIIISIIFFDFINAKYNNKKPFFAIKTENKEEQMIIYNGLFYKTYECTAEEGNYLTKSIFYKIKPNYCPQKYSYDFIDGYFINSNNVKIEKNKFEMLKTFYPFSKIDTMSQEEVDKALNDIKNYVPAEKH